MARYRIEHHDGEAIVLMKTIVQPLEPIATDLARQGKTGELRLVNADTNVVVIRMPIPAHDAPASERTC